MGRWRRRAVACGSALRRRQNPGALPRPALPPCAIPCLSLRASPSHPAPSPQTTPLTQTTQKKPTNQKKKKKQYGLVHISAGDLLREQVALGSPAGLRAKAFMDAGDLVPDEVVVDMVKARLDAPDARRRGWLLDGYPRSGSQAEAIEREGIRPDVFVLLEVPDALLVERVVGRRMDAQTGAIYHLVHNPPPPEVAGRLVQRSDDTEDKAVARLATHRRNVDAVMGYYADRCAPVRGDRAMAEVFASIEGVLDAALAKGAEGEDPLDRFCEGNPSEPECRVYDE